MKHFINRGISFFLIFTLMLSVLLTGCTVKPEKTPEKVQIGIAWSADKDAYIDVCRAIEEAGATPILLDQVQSADVMYDQQKVLPEFIDEHDILESEYAERIKKNTYQGSNVEEVIGNLKAIVFTGGEDVMPTLYKYPEEWHGIEAEKDYNATRDISDYLLMSYCIDQDLAVMGFCRGMQMLSIVSGASVIQDIPTYFENQEKTYHNEHRNMKVEDIDWDYASHDVTIKKDSLLYKITGTETLKNVPSWHHQAIKDVDGTSLEVTGTTKVSGEEMIEVVEIPNKEFIIGVQFHPEAAIVKNLENADNKDKFMKYDDAIKFFTALKNNAKDR